MNDDPVRQGRINGGIQKGAVYTLEDVFETIHGVGVTLLDLPLPTGWDGWHAERFAPIQERKTDIEIGWMWGSFGGALMLVTDRDGAKVIIAAAGTTIVTRDQRTGSLRPIVATDDPARLIAAAPDMAAVCQMIIDAVEGGDEMAVVDAARAALAKARGEAP